MRGLGARKLCWREAAAAAFLRPPPLVHYMHHQHHLQYLKSRSTSASAQTDGPALIRCATRTAGLEYNRPSRAPVYRKQVLAR